MIDMQLLNDALAAFAFIAGLAILLSVLTVAAGALTQRHARKSGVRRIERHLAAVAEPEREATTR